MLYYVDSSVILSLSFGEVTSDAIRQKLTASTLWFSSYLLEAEIRAAFAREEIGFDEREVERIRWIATDRRLTREMEAILSRRRLRGADLWHVACAMYVQDAIGDIEFATLDMTQRNAAADVGLRVTDFS